MTESGGSAKYLTVRQHLLKRIQALEPGAQIPPEPALCEEYGVSRITLRHAVDGLISEGYLVREHGRGTFVVEPQYGIRYRERFDGAVTGFHAQQSSMGLTVTSRVLEFHEVSAGEPSATALGLNAADRVARLVRLRSVNGHVHHLAVTDVPLNRFGQVISAELTDASLFQYLTDNFGVELARNSLTVGIHSADDVLAAHLDVHPGERLLMVRSTVFDAKDQPVAYSVSYFAPQHSEVSFDLRS